MPAGDEVASGDRPLVADSYIQMYALDVRFAWHAAKSEANLRDRGFDFEFATLVFSGPTLEREDARHDYGERRVLAIGVADGVHLALVYTDRRIGRRGIERRITSARRASRKERAVYEAAVRAKGAEPGTRRS
jgi:hypothetical protein